MSATSQNTDNQEIDLTMISNKINGFFSGIGSLIYRSIQFFKRNLFKFYRGNCFLSVYLFNLFS